MTAALISMVFLIATWAAAVAVLAVLDESSGKIAAALGGRSLRSQELGQVRHVTVRFSPRHPPQRSMALRAAAVPTAIEWRAAA